MGRLPSACRSRDAYPGTASKAPRGDRLAPRNRLRRADARVNVGMTVAFTLISILGIIVFFKGGDEGVGILFCGLTCIYISDFFASLKADIGPLGNLGERALGAFHLATGFWLFYLMFADILNSVLKFTLYI